MVKKSLLLTFTKKGKLTAAPLCTIIKNPTIKLNLIFFLTIFVKQIYGQNTNSLQLSGQIIASYNGKPIGTAAIVLNKTKGIFCDSLGRFTIKNLNSGTYNVKFSAFGHENADTTIIINNENIDNFRWIIKTSQCNILNKLKALADINTNDIKLYLQGGIAPVSYSTDKKFQKKYKLTLNDFGCVADDYEECIVEYNQTIFDYLDKTFGIKWRQEIRTDIIGLTKK